MLTSEVVSGAGAAQRRSAGIRRGVFSARALHFKGKRPQDDQKGGEKALLAGKLWSRYLTA